MILNALAGKPLPVYGDGQQIRDWLYVKDHCSAIRRVLKPAGWAKPTTSAAGTRNPTSRSCTPSVRCWMSSARGPMASLPGADHLRHGPPGHDRRYAIDARKIERELGWRPAETFESGIRKTVQWYLDNPTGSRMCNPAPIGPGLRRITRTQLMKILLFGKNGQVGWELQRSLAPWANWWRSSSQPASCVATSPSLDGYRGHCSRNALRM